MERTERSSIQPPLSAHDTDFAYPREGGHVRDISSDHIMSAPTCAATGTPKKGRFGAKALTVEVPLTSTHTMTTPKAPKAIDQLKKCTFRAKALAVMNALKAVKLAKEAVAMAKGLRSSKGSVSHHQFLEILSMIL